MCKVTVFLLQCNSVCFIFAAETDKAPENSEEEEVESEKHATQASGILYNICITCYLNLILIRTC